MINKLSLPSSVIIIWRISHTEWLRASEPWVSWVWLL